MERKSTALDASGGATSRAATMSNNNISGGSSNPFSIDSILSNHISGQHPQQQQQQQKHQQQLNLQQQLLIQQQFHQLQQQANQNIDMTSRAKLSGEQQLASSLLPAVAYPNFLYLLTMMQQMQQHQHTLAQQRQLQQAILEQQQQHQQQQQQQQLQLQRQQVQLQHHQQQQHRSLASTRTQQKHHHLLRGASPPITPTKSAKDQEQSTALSSLSSFVARIEPLQTTPGGGGKRAKSGQAESPAPQGKPVATTTTTKQITTPTPTTPTPVGGNTNNNSSPLNSTLNTAINIAKAPPELVQKQPAWVFCTRYSDRPSSGPRTRRAKSKDKKAKETKASVDEKRPRTAFTNEQLEKLRQEFQANSYLDERRRKDLADKLKLNENQIKIWFQNKRAKIKKQSNQPNPLRGLLVAGGLYNHSTATSDCSESYANGNDHDDDDDEIEQDDDQNNNRTTSSQTPPNHLNHPNQNQVNPLKRPRDQQQHTDLRQQCNSQQRMVFNNTEAETGMHMSSAGSAAKRIRVDYAASDAGSESSRHLDGDDEDEQVISVS